MKRFYKIFHRVVIMFALLWANGMSVDRAKAQPASIINSDTNIWGNILWGKPTNSIWLGLKLVPEQSKIRFYIIGVETNMGHGFIAPRGIQPIEIMLLDESGAQIVRETSSTQFTNRVYKTLAEVPKNSRRVSIGHLQLQGQTPIQLAEITITNYTKSEESPASVGLITTWPIQDRITNVFRIGHLGDFTLVVKGRVMRIEPKTGNLTPIELPSVSARIPLP
jgi:hypothetical protein